jgi:hypothetical protein
MNRSWWRRLMDWMFGRPILQLATDVSPPERRPLALTKSRLPGPITKMFERELAMGGDDDTVRVSFESSTFELDEDDQTILAEVCRRSTTLK